MAVNKVDLYVSQIKQLLDEGYTWLEKDNLGYGSIETKYNANAVQIAAIRKHPKLKDLETNITIFNIIDDESTSISPKQQRVVRSTEVLEQPMVSMDDNNTKMGSDTNEAANLFAQL